MPHKEPFQYPNEPYQCMDCGEILQGPHKGEHNPDFHHTDTYKGTDYSNALCDACDAKRHARLRNEIKAYRSQRDRRLQHEREHST